MRYATSPATTTSFNPRARRGRDGCLQGQTTSCWGFNPHALGGARPEPFGGSMKTTLFQSTRPRRARRVVMSWITLEEVFQSTRPQGARPPVLDPSVQLLTVSIHAPAEGATSWQASCSPSASFSIHAPAGGAACSLAVAGGEDIVSIHAPARGATPDILFNGQPIEVSIHAPTGGATTWQPCR